MIKNFTKRMVQSTLAITALFFAAFQVGSAQYVLTVNSPADIAGDYPVVLAAFGDQSGDTFSADLALANDGSTDDSNGDGVPGTETDGCQAIANGADVDGKMAIIDRGDCSFAFKADNLSATSAIAMLVCNNQATDPISMSGTSSFTGTAVMMSQANCNVIKMALANGDVNVTFQFKCDAVYPEGAFWGGEEGQGDFSQGLGDWTVGATTTTNTPVTDVTWKWTNDGTADCGFFGAGRAIESGTVCNGAAYFDFCDYTITQFPSPTQPYPTYTAELISPIIDCSGQDNVVLYFTNLNNRLNGTNTVSYSIDGGATWSTPVNVETANVTNTLLNTELINLPAPLFDGQSNCRIKFTASGDFYYWIIDDVHLKSEAKSDVRLNSNWYSGASDYLFPEGQGTQGIPFMVDLTTLGNASPGQTVVNVEVLDEAGNQLYTSSLDYGVLTVDSTYENNVFPELFTPSGENGTYTIRYSVDAEVDENPANDVLESQFTIGGQVFSKVALDSDGIQGWRYNSQSNFASVGNNYHFVNGTWPNGNPLKVDSVSFGYSVSGDVSHLGFAYVSIYQWDDVNGDGLVQGEPNNERFLLGGGEAFIDQDSAGRILTVPVFADGTTDEALVLPDADDMNIVVMVHFSPIDPGQDANGNDANWFFYAVNADGIYGQFNASAGVFALEAGFQIIQPASIFGSGTADDIEERVFDQSGALIFHTPMFLSGLVSGTEDYNPNVKMSVYPNPTADYVNVDINLENNAEFVNILVSDITGKIVMAKQFKNVSAKEVNLDLTNLNAGVYTLQVSTPEGFNSTNLSVVK